MQIRSSEQLRAEFAEITDLLDRALAADNTAEMAELSAAAHSAEAGLRQYLDDLLQDAFTLYDNKLQRDDLEPGRNVLGEAIERGEAVGLAVDLPSMRARVQDFSVISREAIASIAM